MGKRCHIMLFISLVTSTNLTINDKCDSQFYKHLNESFRYGPRPVHNEGWAYCDQNGHDQNTDWKGSSWYRFEGLLYNQLATYPPGPIACGSYYPGWLTGQLPTLEEGEKTMKVCFQSYGIGWHECFMDTSVV